MSKIIVTGGAGFIGSHLVDALIEKGHSVLVIDNLSTGKKENLNVKAQFVQADICDFEKIKPLFLGADFVFHLAAIPRVPISVSDPLGTSRVNIMGTLNVFLASRDSDVKRVIFASSSSVYGDQKTLPLEEDMLALPKSPYALQKMVGEHWARLFGELYRLPIVCLRYFNVYGPRLLFDSDYSLVLGKFLQLQKQNKPLPIFGDGQQSRGFCYVADIVRANLLAMESGKIKSGAIINAGSEESVTVNQIANLIGGEKQYLPPREGDILHSQADTSKAKELLGWQPEVGFAQGFQLTKQWFEQQITKNK